MILENSSNEITGQATGNPSLYPSFNNVGEFYNYEEIKYAKDFDFHFPDMENENSAVKRFISNEITTAIFSLLFMIGLFILIHFLMPNQANTANPNPKATFLLYTYIIIITIILVRPIVAILGKKTVAEGIVIGKTITRTRTSNGSISHYKLYVAQSRSRKICQSVKTSYSEYSKIHDGDRVFIIKSGYIYMGIKEI